MTRPKEPARNRAAWRDRLHEIIFESDTPIGKYFDEALIGAILLSVVAVMLESIDSVRQQYGGSLYLAEWIFTIVFSFEYIVRLVTVRRPIDYATSFFGVVDLLAVIPTYLSLFFPGTQYLLVIRLLRLLRVFRVLKLVAYVSEASMLTRAIRASRRKITVFLLTVSILVVILGSMMYFIEGSENGFTSIPRAVYWAIVTLTTVGYGDISPQTPMGQALAAFVMIMGYGIIAIPTGIVTAELARGDRSVSGQACPACGREGHDTVAKFCKHCGSRL